jgi:hypothetical protein
MGVRHTECTGCGRSGSAHEDTNYIYECGRCELDRLNSRIKRSVKQIWWIELLYWLTDKKSTIYYRENIKQLHELIVKNI